MTPTVMFEKGKHAIVISGVALSTLVLGACNGDDDDVEEAATEVVDELETVGTEAVDELEDAIDETEDGA